jgi:hypothetical protein
VANLAKDRDWTLGMLIPIEGAHQNEMIAPAVTE